MATRTPAGTGAQQVAAFLEALDHPLKPEILHLRTLVLDAGADLTEQIKWNAPSFCCDGDDRITMKLYPPHSVQLVFHRGAGVREQPKERLITDEEGLLKWAANDRAIATFTGSDDIAAKRAALQDVVRRWIRATQHPA